MRNRSGKTGDQGENRMLSEENRRWDPRRQADRDSGEKGQELRGKGSRDPEGKGQECREKGARTLEKRGQEPRREGGRTIGETVVRTSKGAGRNQGETGKRTLAKGMGTQEKRCLEPGERGGGQEPRRKGGWIPGELGDVTQS